MEESTRHMALHPGREVESSSPCQRDAIAVTRHVQCMVVELVSMHPTSQGRDFTT